MKASSKIVLAILWVGLGTGDHPHREGRVPRAAAAAGGVLLPILERCGRRGGHPDRGRRKTGVRAADGTLWFSTSGGAHARRPDCGLGRSPPLPPIRIESVTADGQRFDPETRLFEPSHASRTCTSCSTR